MIETCFQVLPGRGQVRALRAALRPPWNASSLLIGRHRSALSLSLSLSLFLFLCLCPRLYPRSCCSAACACSSSRNRWTAFLRRSISDPDNCVTATTDTVVIEEKETELAWIMMKRSTVWIFHEIVHERFSSFYDEAFKLKKIRRLGVDRWFRDLGV